MATDLERLVVSLEARITQYEKELAKANRLTQQRTREIENRFSGMGKKISGMFGDIGAGFVKGLAGGLVAGGVAGLASAVQDVTKSVASLKAEAQRAGLPVEDFQRLTYAAELAQVGTDALTDGVKELQLRIDEFIKTGAGPAAESLQRLGFTSEELATKLRRPQDLLIEVINRTRDLDDTAAGIRIFDEIFGGTGGEQFVRFLAMGRGELETAIDRADELGRVLSSEAIDKAVELDRKFAAVAGTVGTLLKGAIVSAADALAAFLEMIPDVSMGGADPLAPGRLRARQDLLNQLSFGGGGDFVGFEDIRDRVSNNDAIKAQELARQQFESGIAKLRTALSGGDTFTDFNDFGNVRTQAIGTGSSSGGGVRKSAQENDFQAWERLLQRRLEAYQLESEALIRFGGNADLAREYVDGLVAAQDAGIPVTEALRQQIAGSAQELTEAADAADAARAAQDRLGEAMASVNDEARSALGGFISDLRQGVDAGEALANTLDRLADRALDVALNALFPSSGGGGLLAMLFGGGRASGGPVRSGRAYRVGEMGPETFVPTVNGHIVPDKARIVPSIETPAVALHVTIDATGADPAELVRVSRALDDLRASVPKMAVAAQRGSKLGRPIR